MAIIHLPVLGVQSRVNPEVAIISVRTGNTYGHLAPETLDKLQSVGVRLYRTDLNDNVIKPITYPTNV